MAIDAAGELEVHALTKLGEVHEAQKTNIEVTSVEPNTESEADADAEVSLIHNVVALDTLASNYWSSM